MNIQFRRLLPHESSLYRTIRLKCLKQYPENFGSNYQDEIKKKKLFFEDHLENENPDNFVIGGFYNGRLIAISGFNRYDSLKTKHRGRIIQVYVSPEFQGHNIGFNLVKATVEEAFNNEEIEQIEIDVLVNNTKAESIYSKIGFKTYGIQEKYLKIGEMYFDHRMMYIFADNYHSS